MTDHNETSHHPIEDPLGTSKSPERRKRSSPIDRLKELYAEKPLAFGLGVMGISGVLFLLGGFVSGDIDLSTPPGPLVP